MNKWQSNEQNNQLRIESLVAAKIKTGEKEHKVSFQSPIGVWYQNLTHWMIWEIGKLISDQAESNHESDYFPD